MSHDHDETIEAIQQRMRHVRGTMGEEVIDLVESTRDMTNWRKYVRANPWKCLAAAAVVSYVIVPKRTATHTWNESELKKVVEKVASTSPAPRRSSLRGELVSWLGHAAFRAFVAYMGNRMAMSSIMQQETEDSRPMRRSPK